MTLQELKDKIEYICLQHKAINSFAYGREFSVMGDKEHEYPQAFLELPYNLTYFPEQQQFKAIDFAIMFLFNQKQDSLVDQHIGISNADQICDAIVARMQHDFTGEVAFVNINSVSLQEYTAQDLSGIRCEFQARMKRENNSNPNCYETNFKDL
jgi:hypothetical protein